MKIKSQKDFWSGVMFVAVGLGFAWGAQEYSLGDSARPGPGYFPLGLGLIMAGLGALIVFKALLAGPRNGDPIGAMAWRPLLIVVASVALFGALLPRLGMLLSLPLLVVTTALAGQEFRWGEALVNGVLLTVFSWVIFIWGLSLTIPLLPWFIR